MTKSPRFSPTHPRSVEIVTFAGVQLFDIAGPLQTFASINRLFQAEGRESPYTVRLSAHEGAIVTTAEGLGLSASVTTPKDGHEADTLIIAGGPGAYRAAADPDLIAWLKPRALCARRVASVCSGAFIFAATGLLNGKRAVTHWSRCAELARSYPEIRVETDPIFVRDGTMWPSAGVSAGIDLTLAMIEEDLGRGPALAAARDMVVFLKRSGGQNQFSATLRLQLSDDRFGALHAWINDHLSNDLSISILAAQAGMSERSFVRHYRDSTGLTPARSIQCLRVEAARQLLSHTRQPVKQIAQRCGLGSEETMRRSFIRILGTTPQTYREHFSD